MRLAATRRGARRLGAAAVLLLLVAPFWRRSWRHRLGRLTVLTGYGYVGVVLLMVSQENRLLYQATPAAETWLPPPAVMRVEDVSLTTADGTSIHGWWSAPYDSEPAQGATLFCHGNAGNVSQWGQNFAEWQARLGTAVFVFDYPGYGKSGGLPSEEGCCAAGDAACDWLTAVKRVAPENIVLLGLSLGTGVATDLASRRPHRALVLCSAYTSFPELAQAKFPWLPGRWLAHNQFDNLRKIAACRGPVFIAHGTADALIPFEHGQRLFAAAGEPKRFLAQPGRGHNDTADDAFYAAAGRFLDETAPPVSPAPAPPKADVPLIPADARPEKVWGDGEFTEGPAYGPGGFVYFSDIGDRIMRYDPATGKTTEYRKPSGRANGLDFDPEGRLVAAEGANTGGNRRVTRTEKDGKITVLADRWKGKKFNSPNDVTVDVKGRVYFSDPRYVGDEPRELDSEDVYRIDPDGTLTRLITDVEKPNGVVLSPGMKTLYVAEANPKGKQQLLAYPVQEDGGVGAKKVLYDFGKARGIDGMVVDAKGNVYAAAGDGKTGGVYVFGPEGKRVGFIPIPETPTNCVFGEKDRRTLYVTAGKSLYRVRLNAEGFAVFWPKE